MLELQEASLLHDRPFSAAASVYISRKAWETQNHQTFSSISLLTTRGQETLYETCACVIHTNLQLHYYSAIWVDGTHIRNEIHGIVRLYETLHDI